MSMQVTLPWVSDLFKSPTYNNNATDTQAPLQRVKKENSLSVFLYCSHYFYIHCHSLLFQRSTRFSISLSSLFSFLFIVSIKFSRFLHFSYLFSYLFGFILFFYIYSYFSLFLWPLLFSLSLFLSSLFSSFLMFLLNPSQLFCSAPSSCFYSILHYTSVFFFLDDANMVTFLL